MLLVIAASVTLAAAGQPDTNSLWSRIPGGPGTGCAHDSTYAFFVHSGDDQRLAIFLNGGGACWNNSNCDLHARPTYHPQLDSTDVPDQQDGIFNLSNPHNPIRGYTVVFIPYCTADVFLGGRTVSYTRADTTGASHQFAVRHRGRANADQAVAWVFAHYPTPQLVFVAGSSAGAIPSPFYATRVARHYPHARIVQLGDGAGGYRAPPIPGILALWGATELLRSDSAFRGVDSASLTFETLYEVAARTTPQVTFAQYNSAEDNVQLSFLAQLGVHDVKLATLLAANLADIRQVNPALRTYTSPGPMHTILRRREFYNLSVDGVLVRDWVADLLDGKRVTDVDESLLAGNTVLDSVSRYVEAERVRQRIPGVSIAILRGDSVVLARGFGYANVELHAPASDSTIYQSGSTGKQFTAAAVVMLAEQGKLSLDDPITRFLPEGPPAWRAITIRHLLTHTSGIPDYADSTMDWRHDYTEDQLVPIVAKKPPLFAPGERWSYSNTGYLLLGIIIHRASGVFYGDFLRDHVFHPLGMRTTRVISEADIVPNRAAGYELVNDTLKNQDWVSPTLNTTADGALYFTVRDLAQWAIGLNHARVPSPQGLATIWTPLRLNNGGTYPYGFGWEITQQRGARRIGHSGSWQGFKAAIERYPDFNLTVIVLANLAQARQEAIAFGIAGIMEPRLTAAHLLLPGALPGAPREPLDHLLHAITARDSSATITPALRAFIGDDTRDDFAAAIDGVRAWTPLGCDDVANRDIVQLGTRITRVCYSKAARSRSNLLMIGLYGADGRAANLDYYSF